VLIAQPRQQQVALVRDLGLALDDRGFVRIDETTRETSVPGIHAAGDLTTAESGPRDGDTLIAEQGPSTSSAQDVSPAATPPPPGARSVPSTPARERIRGRGGQSPFH
jgi:thioredoxin reductase